MITTVDISEIYVGVAFLAKCNPGRIMCALGCRVGIAAFGP